MNCNKMDSTRPSKSLQNREETLRREHKSSQQITIHGYMIERNLLELDTDFTVANVLLLAIISMVGWV